ncbi:cathepsin 8 [Capsella rubella]|uniref:cathepsin 8 n=1 Tax=Capsella rubella TaxID=81985 RepID=UPI000CD51120|nr:cathepsin 8 [Capsella rubella]
MDSTRIEDLLPLPVIYESDELFSEIKKICKIIPLSLLIKILEVEPEAKFELIRVTNIIRKNTPTEESIDITYARLRKHRVLPDETKTKDWSPYYGIVLDQGNHDMCWAIVAAELVKAIRWIRGRESGTEYSFQELIDFVDQEKGKYSKKNGHFCYTLSIIKALTYIVEKGIQREVDRPFVGCRAVPPPRILLNSELGFIGAAKKIPTIEEALVHLQKQPLGAAFPIFLPDYTQIREEIYQGPMYKGSMFVGMHAVSVVKAGVDESTGESFMMVRSSHGEKIGVNGYLKVSIDVMLLRTSKECHNKDAESYFQTPTPLLTRFCYPELLEESEEKKRKKKLTDQLATMNRRKGNTSS